MGGQAINDLESGHVGEKSRAMLTGGYPCAWGGGSLGRRKKLMGEREKDSHPFGL